MSPTSQTTCRIAFWAIALLLCVPWAAILAVWGYFDGLDGGRGPLTALFYIAAFIALVVAAGRWLGRGDRDSRFLWRTALLALIATGLGLTMIDDPYPELRYTRDLLRVPPEVEASRDILMTFTVGGTQSVAAASKSLQDALGWDGAADGEHAADLTSHRAEIERLWVDLLPARQLIERLDTFPGICELANDTVLDASVPIPRYIEWKRLTQGYCAYAIQQAQQGKADEGLRELIRLHSVLRKWLPHSTVLVCRMITIDLINREMAAVHRILQMGTLSSNLLAQLNSTFTPLGEEDVSVRRSAIAELLAIRASLEAIDGPGSLRQLMVRGGQPSSASRVRLEELAMGFLPFRKNASIAFLEELYTPIIDPDRLGNAHKGQSAGPSRSRRNTLGEALLSRVAMPDYAKASERCKIVKVRSDLLSLEISRRMGQPREANDILNGGSYRYDEASSSYFSIGPDGIPGNADDVRIGP